MMLKKFLIFYIMVFSIPVLLALVVWQSTRYQNLTRELVRLEQAQNEWIESNKRLIAGVAEYSSPERIEYIARNRLNLNKIRPEHFLQVRITGGEGREHY
jgi:cell division protein FtsL